ncbi:MAG: putative toxin-antitoxin system toxin component, PIN family [Chloroflexota bacterium]
MIRAVIDTNVLASGFVRRHPQALPFLILDAWHDREFELICSAEIVEELERTLQSPYFAKRLCPEQVRDVLSLLREEATLAQVTTHVAGVATHPEDDVILAVSVSATADYLVTGDTKLQQLVRYQTVQVVTPRQFLEVLEQTRSEPPAP